MTTQAHGLSLEDFTAWEAGLDIEHELVRPFAVPSSSSKFFPNRRPRSIATTNSTSIRSIESLEEYVLIDSLSSVAMTLSIDDPYDADGVALERPE